VLLVTGTILALSCTRMPTAPRTEINVVGHVVGPSGEPLPRTALAFRPGERALLESGFAITDASGSFSVRLLSGTYQVQIQPPIGLMSRTERVTVSDRNCRVDFAFLGFRVTGTVVDPNGSLLDSGWVAAQQPGVGFASSPVRQGSYSLFLPAGKYSFQAGSDDYWSGFSPMRQESVQIPADTTIHFRLNGILISGKVLGPDGLAMKNVGVHAEGIGQFAYARNRTTVDGGYRLYVPSGSYRLWFRPPHPAIIPRVVGPQTITVPTSIDVDLSGIEWSGTVRLFGTNEPAPGIIVLVRMIDDDDRSAAIRTGAQGDFRFIVEADRRYDLSTYDEGRREEVVRVQGITAAADTAFEILIPPPPAP
jgi:hypothetical protein